MLNLYWQFPGGWHQCDSAHIRENRKKILFFYGHSASLAHCYVGSALRHFPWMHRMVTHQQVNSRQFITLWLEHIRLVAQTKTKQESRTEMFSPNWSLKNVVLFFMCAVNSVSGDHECRNCTVWTWSSLYESSNSAFTFRSKA